MAGHDRRRDLRYCDRQSDWSTRLFGVGGTMLIAALVLASAFVTWTIVRPAPPTARPMVVNLLPLASPPQPVRDVAPGPQQVERQAARPDTRLSAAPVPVIPLPAPPVAAPRPAEDTPPADPAPPVVQTTAPRTIAAPALDRLSDAARPDWEGVLLAHLERFRRYPPRARAAQQQGIVYVRFRMNRAGSVLEAQVVRGSGSVSLDQAALDTLRRAQPLPAIPPDKPDQLELTMPVEFHLGLR